MGKVREIRRSKEEEVEGGENRKRSRDLWGFRRKRVRKRRKGREV